MAPDVMMVQGVPDVTTVQGVPDVTTVQGVPDVMTVQGVPDVMTVQSVPDVMTVQGVDLGIGPSSQTSGQVLQRVGHRSCEHVFNVYCSCTYLLT